MEAKLQNLLSGKANIVAVELNWLEMHLKKRGNESLEERLNIVALKKGVDPRYVLITKKKAKSNFYNAVIESESEIVGKQLSSAFDGVKYRVITDSIDAALERLQDEKCEGLLLSQISLGKRRKLKGLRYEHLGVELIVPASGQGIIALLENANLSEKNNEKSDKEATLRLGIEREIIKRTVIDEESICIHAQIHRGELRVSAFIDINDGIRLLQKGSIKHRERIVSAMVEKIDHIVIK